CGICEPGQSLDPSAFNLMLEAMAAPGEFPQKTAGRDSVLLGVSRRWEFQQTASIPGVHISADAELLNRSELIEAVKQRDFDANNISSAELLARLYREQGIDFVDLLDGVFSFALWDEQHQRLLLAIDRLGVNSLYWRKEKARILFASHVRGISSVQDTPPQVNSAALGQYMLFSAVPAPLSIYQGIEKLQPGSCLIYEAGQLRTIRYWDISYRESENNSIAHWSREVQEGMRAAVKRHLTDLDTSKTGAYLSGGT